MCVHSGASGLAAESPFLTGEDSQSVPLSQLNIVASDISSRVTGGYLVGEKMTKYLDG